MVKHMPCVHPKSVAFGTAPPSVPFHPFPAQNRGMKQKGVTKAKCKYKFSRFVRLGVCLGIRGRKGLGAAR